MLRGRGGHRAALTERGGHCARLGGTLREAAGCCVGGRAVLRHDFRSGAGGGEKVAKPRALPRDGEWQ